jgi:hypothetical protein
MKTFNPPQHEAKGPFRGPSVVGLLFLVCAIYNTINSVRAGGWHWQFLPLAGTPAAMGLYLILLALSAQNKPVASGESADPDCGGGDLPS